MKFIQARKRAKAMTRDHANVKPTRQTRNAPKSRARANATRDKIVEYLVEPRSAKQIAEHCKLNLAITSYHLGILQES